MNDGKINDKVLNDEKEKFEKNENPSNRYNLSTKPLTPDEEIVEALRANEPVFIHGPSGTGKSSRIRELDPDCVILSMENATKYSFSGKSFYNSETGQMEDGAPTWFTKLCEVCERDKDQIHILFLDEFTHADESVQTKVNNLLTTRVLDGKWVLPSNARIVLAGNEVEESLGSSALDQTIISRVSHVYINTTVEEWLEWAKNPDSYKEKFSTHLRIESKGIISEKRKSKWESDLKINKSTNNKRIHPLVIEFIEENPEFFITEYDGKTPNVNPRKWEMVSKVLYETNNPQILAPLIGDRITAFFVSFCNAKHYEKIKSEKVKQDRVLMNYIKSDIPIFLHGKPGVGKSQRIKQIDPDMVELNMRNETTESFVGKPVLNSKQNKLIDIKPSWFKKIEQKCIDEPDRIHILFLDEFTHADPGVQVKLNNLIVDRVLDGKWKLPSNCRIVAAGNEIEDSEAANELEETIYNRFAHLEIIVDIDEWLNWARENEIHPAIIDFIERYGEKVLIGQRINPRIWEKASNILKSSGNIYATMPMLRDITAKTPEEVNRLFNQFLAFCKTESNIITLRKVLTGDYSYEEIISLNVAEQNGLIERLIRVDENIDNIRKVIEFIKDNLKPEHYEVFKQRWVIGSVLRQQIITIVERVIERSNTAKKVSGKK